MVLLYKMWKNRKEIQLTKNKMDLNIREMTIIHPRTLVGFKWSVQPIHHAKAMGAPELLLQPEGNEKNIIIIIIIIIIVVEKSQQSKVGRERESYQSEDPNPTQPTYGRKTNRK